MLSIYTGSNVVPFDKNIRNKVAANSNEKKLSPTITQQFYFVVIWSNLILSLANSSSKKEQASNKLRVVNSDSSPKISKINIDTLDGNFISFIGFDYNSARQIIQRIDKKYLSRIIMIDKNNTGRIRVTHEIQNGALLTEDLEVLVNGKQYP